MPPHLSETLNRLIQDFSKQQILLVGDMVADHYILGNTSRISREAPVMILKLERETVVPGQAGNTACNIAALEGNVTAIGVIGTDFRGKVLREALELRNVKTSGLIELPNVSTLSKTRILAGGHHTCRQQVIRIDDDERMSISPEIHKRVVTQMRKLAVKSTGIVISDYGYGLISDEVWEAAVSLKTQYGIPLILDSRYDLVKRKNATLVTPNEEEAVLCTGRFLMKGKNIDLVGRALRKITNAESVLVTRGNEGMVLFAAGRMIEEIPIFGPVECTDVTGAGDTVVATAALAMAAGGNSSEAANLANVAGGLVVMKMGTATVSRTELKNGVEILQREMKAYETEQKLERKKLRLKPLK